MPTFDGDISQSRASKQQIRPIHIVGMPYAGRGNPYPSTKAPVVVRERSFQSTASDDWFYGSDGLRFQFSAADIIDEGDSELNNAEHITSIVDEIVVENANAGRESLVIGIGGDDECSYHFASGWAVPTVVSYDAHLDTVDDLPAMDHSNWLRVGLEDKSFREAHHFGARGPQIGSSTTPIAGLFVWDDLDMVEFEVSRGEGPVVLAVDMDVFDPAFAPGVAYRVSGANFAPHKLLEHLWKMTFNPRVTGVAITEVSPDRDANFATSDLCVSVIHHLVGGFVQRQQVHKS